METATKSVKVVPREFGTFAVTNVEQGNVNMDLMENLDGEPTGGIIYAHNVVSAQISGEPQYGGIRLYLTMRDGYTFTIVTYPE